MRTVGLLAFFIVVFGPIAALAVDAAGLFASGGPWPALTARHGALLARTFVLAAGVADGEDNSGGRF